MTFSVIKTGEKTAELEFFSSRLVCQKRLFPVGVRENDLVYFENGAFFPDRLRTEEKKRDLHRRALNIAKNKNGRER